jgi:hypothetical protein
MPLGIAPRVRDLPTTTKIVPTREGEASRTPLHRLNHPSSLPIANSSTASAKLPRPLNRWAISPARWGWLRHFYRARCDAFLL